MENKLYEISNALIGLEEIMDEDNDPQLYEYLDSIKMELTQKVDNIVMRLRTLELTSKAVDTEIDRLDSLKKYYDRRGQKLKSYLAHNLQMIGKDRLETEKAVLSFRKSKTTDILDPTLIPAEFIKTKTVESIDKTLIAKIIDGGDEVPGAVRTIHNNLQIK
jgi:hypothetical protein